MAKGLFETLNAYTSATGQVVTRTTGSVVAGVGDVVVAGKLPKARSQAPEIADHTSEAALQKYKDYSINVNLRAGRIGLISSIIDRFANVFWLALATTTGVMLGLKEGSSAAALADGGMTLGLMVTGALTLTLTSFLFKQFITRDQTEKGLDVEDFKLKRSAQLVGKELNKNRSGEDISTTRSKTTEEPIVRKHVVSQVKWEGQQVAPEHITHVH